MKNNIIIILLALLACSMSNCTPEKKHFDEKLLIGKWKRPSTLTRGDDCYRYDSGGGGVTWDTGDDVTEAEGQPFTWTLSSSNLVLIHIGEMGQKIPKSYTMQTLTSTTLSYRDSYGTTYTFSKF